MATHDLSYLRSKVFQCFPPGVPPPSQIKLKHAVIADDWGAETKDWPEEKWKSWDEIPDALLTRAECLLTYFDGEELVYLLPRFILRLLDEMEAGSCEISNETDSLVSHLTSWRFESYAKLPLGLDQKRLLDEIYELARQNPDLKMTIDSTLQLLGNRRSYDEASRDLPSSL